jgi:AraC-like DNA-binding protein
MYRFGRREYVAGPCTAMFVARGWEFTRLSKPGAMLALGLDQDALLHEIASRRQLERGKLQLTSRPFTINPAAHARLAALLDDLVRATAPGADLRQAEPAEASLVAAVADMLLEQSAAVAVRTGATARMREVEEWIEANLGGPITAGRLCQVAGVGHRGLEKIFEARHGMSPMRFVTERRLAAAHRMLVRDGAPDRDVTSVAIGVGFGHPGRFATLYRQAYGESPSQSLRRARRRTGAELPT